MIKLVSILILITCFFSIDHRPWTIDCYAETVELKDLPPLPKDTLLFASEKMFGYRSKVGAFVYSPCKIGAYFDKDVSCEPGKGHPAMKMMYHKADKKAFCGAYVILMGDLTKYKTLSFMVKGSNGGESFEIGLNDVISNKREDAVFIGAINRYLPGGVTTEWQEVNIPLSDFYGPDLSRAYSLIFHFNDVSKGLFWVDNIRFSTEDPVSKKRAEDIKQKGFLLLDNFDSSDLNLLGRKTNAYKKLPSVCKFERTEEEHYGPSGRSLRIYYKKDPAGWCGYYTLLNQIDGEYYDLSPYKTVSFMVKGKKGGEKFELGMADKNWVIIGDSLKAGSVDRYLPNGVTNQWQEVIIPLEDFGLLDLTQMGSFVINFYENGESAVYIDDLKFYLK